MTEAHDGPENRLAGEISPYLLLHKTNPVDWYPWGEEALQRAREEDKPIFLSVGYSTCYWCHVMERESFSDPAIAELMNRCFVNVKLDREERPELDEIYMNATQLLTQQGGWPNSVFLTPELVPFFAGTYFPSEGRHGLPSFRNVLLNMADAWENRRSDVEEQAAELERAMRHFFERRDAGARDAPPPPAAAERALASLRERFDAENGGFGAPPKFPSPANLFLLEELADERPEAARMLEVTLDRMARGGLYDQLGGGFHRYATDAEWKIPHFEKMLYDNGLLLELYARQHRRTGDGEAARIARETAEFLEREMTAPEGGLWSAIDAETHGHEGASYVWTLDQLAAALGPEDAGFLATLLGYDRSPFFDGDAYVLHLPLPLAEQADRRRMSRDELLAEIAPLKAKLLAARRERDQPAVDDKILTDWNGMAIAGLAEAGRALGDAEIVERAARAARFVLENLRGETLLHSWRGGEARIPAFLSDYVFLVRGLLTLHEATGEERWLAAAAELTAEQIERLGDPRGGFFVAAPGPDVLFRSKEIFDGALPAANAVAILNLLELARRSAELRPLGGRGGELQPWRPTAEAALGAFAGMAELQTDAVRMLCLAARRYHRLAAELGGGSPAAGRAEAAPGSLADEALRRVSAEVEVGEAAEDGWRPFRLVLEVADGWHVYAGVRPAGGEGAAAGGTVRPTELTASGAELREVVYPPGRELAAGGAGVRVYEGRVELRGELRPVGEGKPRLVVACQPCDESRCLPPVEIEVPVGSPASPRSSRSAATHSRIQ